MTEAEWLAATNPTPMLELLRGKASDRKLRLFAVACCHRLTPLMDRSRNRWFHGALSQAAESLEGMGSGTESVVQDYSIPANRPEDVVQRIGDPDAHRGATEVSRATAELAGWASDEWRIKAERTIQGRRIRCVFGNPFRPVAVNPAWLTSDVVALATGIYQDRAFDRMPILADALQDAGCDNDDILNHCRYPGEHVRGCWAVDLILGRQ